MLEQGLSSALNARIFGSGDQTVILAHGYGGDQSVWDKIVPHLAQRYQVVVFDWNFSGAIKDPNLFDPVKYSSYEAFASDLITLVDEMSLTSPVFIGHSMSGMVGCIASTKRPQLFKRLVLLGASPRYLNSDDYEGGFGNSDIEQIFSNIESHFHKWASTFAPLVIDANDPISVNKFENCIKRMKPEVALSMAKTVFLSDERETLENVLTPCTIIQTTNDIVVPFSVTEYMKKMIKGKSTVEIIDTDGHFPQLTAHLQLLEVLDRVLSVSDIEEKRID